MKARLVLNRGGVFAVQEDFSNGMCVRALRPDEFLWAELGDDGLPLDETLKEGLLKGNLALTFVVESSVV